MHVSLSLPSLLRLLQCEHRLEVTTLPLHSYYELSKFHRPLHTEFCELMDGLDGMIVSSVVVKEGNVSSTPKSGQSYHTII